MLVKMETGASGGGSAELKVIAYNNSSVTAFADNDIVTITGSTTFTFKKAVQGYLSTMATLAQLSGTVVTSGNITFVHDRDSYSNRTYMFTANVGDTLTVGGSYPSVYDIVGVET